MKKKIWIYLITMMGVFLMFINSCKKDDNNPTNGKTTAVFNPQITYDTLTDQVRNPYKTIKIGTQTWMAENLRTTKYRNGDAIPEVTDNTAWTDLGSGAYCTFNNTKNNDTIATFGRLYNWFAVSDSRKIAPLGWHVPTETDWTTLITYLGGASIAAGKLKEIGTTHWSTNAGLANSGNSTNSTGFTALPGGFRANYGAFINVGSYGYWWSSSEDNNTLAWFLYMLYHDIYVSNSSGDKNCGFSVRCVKDI